MGVADNKTYKNMYHFRDNYYNLDFGDMPSLKVDPKINHTIKENPYRANVEIEKDEIVLEPDLSALYKANGKKHSGGGVEVNLKPESFIFSNDPSLAINQVNHELFGLKTKNNKFSKIDNTPANVLKRNIDLEHYNKMVVNLDDPKKDDLAKRSSQMMLEKYLQTVGNIAYLQEEKKRFPDGIPAFAMGTAPVYDKTLKEDMDSQKQYMKYGGNVSNPYLPIFADGGRKRQNNADKTGRYSGIAPITPDNTVPMDYPFAPTTPSTDYHTPCAGGYMSYATNPPKWICPDVKGATPAPEPVVPHLDVPQINANPQGAKSADWEFTPWQKISQGWDAAKYAGVKRYMPMRSHFNPSFTEANLVNPEQALGDMRAGMNEQVNSLNTLSPILRNAQASAIYGQYLGAAPQLRSQYDNQNVGIKNQNNSINTQIRNQADQMNTVSDQAYYQQTIQGKQNFDNMKTYLGDQWMNHVQGDVQDNQSLAYNMLMQNNPAYRYDFRTGKFIRNPKSIMDANSINNSREDILSLADSLRKQHYSDALIANIIKSKVFQQSQVSQIPSQYRGQ